MVASSCRSSPRRSTTCAPVATPVPMSFTEMFALRSIWASTPPSSPPSGEHIDTSAPSATTIPATHAPCPPGWRWTSALPGVSAPVGSVTSSTLTVGAGASTVTLGTPERAPSCTSGEMLRTVAIWPR
nr:MAG: hypothetical protein DIU73_09580 [Actinomycetota bacterium]